MDLHGIKQCISCYNNFLDLINFTQKEITSCCNIIADCELNCPLKPKQKTTAIKLLHNYSTKRRDAKDTIAVLNAACIHNWNGYPGNINIPSYIKCPIHGKHYRGGKHRCLILILV